MRELSIKETQEISLEILNVVSKVCDELELRYYLIYGTLIGAVRHNGFIPWDDDVDIMMPRNDYDRLLNYLNQNIKKYPHLKVFNRTNVKEYPYMITRISDERYWIQMENEEPYGMGVFIDIYPYDGLGKTKDEAIRYGLKGDRLSSLCYQASRKKFAIETTSSVFRKVIKFPVYIISKLIGKDYFQNKLDKMQGLYSYEESKYIGCFVWLSGGEKDIFEKEWFNERVKVKFDKYEFYIPKNYDTILKRTYGDYMKLPPQEERIGHHGYKAYAKEDK